MLPLTVLLWTQLRLDAERDHLRGCEWWVQRFDPKDELSFHLDKDECAAAAASRTGQQLLLHPALSSVLYLSSAGGPTCVLPHYAVPDEEADTEVMLLTDAVGELDLVPPAPNGFLAFQGNLMHGVLPAHESQGGGAERLTLLVNWWRGDKVWHVRTGCPLQGSTVCRASAAFAMGRW
eukprot:SAG11_NODE_493_length_8965_cov_4.112339_7_plen_178_part_00